MAGNQFVRKADYPESCQEELAKSKLDFDVIGHYARNDVFKLDVINQPPTRTL